LLISVLHAAALAPITTLADALALAAAVPRDGATRFEYGWACGTGSAAFIAGTLVSGQVVSAWGLTSIIVSHAALLSAAACAAGDPHQWSDSGASAPASRAVTSIAWASRAARSAHRSAGTLVQARAFPPKIARDSGYPTKLTEPRPSCSRPGQHQERREASGGTLRAQGAPRTCCCHGAQRVRQARTSAVHSRQRHHNRHSLEYTHFGKRRHLLRARSA
jgi:hypothetical protein